ncbi:hypothetical protein [Rhizobium mongolense]|uniref:hypothetical protein n=1 Tax=Rhizobium mongolense TaxID=57676 RepID=UPI003FD6E76A
MNEFQIGAQPVAGGFSSLARGSYADEYIGLPTSGNEGNSDLLSRCMSLEAALGGIEGSLVGFTRTEGPNIDQESSCVGRRADGVGRCEQPDENRFTPCGLKHRAPLFDALNGEAASFVPSIGEGANAQLSQHFCIRGSVYKSLSREFKTPMLAHGSQTQLPRLCVKLAPLFGPTVVQAFQCSIRSRDLLPDAISDAHMDRRTPSDPEINPDDSHLNSPVFTASNLPGGANVPWRIGANVAFGLNEGLDA